MGASALKHGCGRTQPTLSGNKAYQVPDQRRVSSYCPKPTPASVFWMIPEPFILQCSFLAQLSTSSLPWVVYPQTLIVTKESKDLASLQPSLGAEFEPQDPSWWKETTSSKRWLPTNRHAMSSVDIYNITKCNLIFFLIEEAWHGSTYLLFQLFKDRDKRISSSRGFLFVCFWFCFKLNLKKQILRRGGEGSSVLEYLPNTCKVPASIPSTRNKLKNKQGNKREENGNQRKGLGATLQSFIFCTFLYTIHSVEVLKQPVRDSML